MAYGRPERDPERPVYVISVAATLVSAHPRTLRIYEDEGLLCPARTPTNIRLYSENDIRRITWIRHLTRERGVNLAGIRILFELEERLGARILEALYAEGTADAEQAEAQAAATAAGGTSLNDPTTTPNPSDATTPIPSTSAGQPSAPSTVGES
jgi:MerR family transcriptional regulator, heat shock protein HspR